MMDRNQDILFLDMSKVDQAQDLLFWERGRGKTEVDQKQDFFCFWVTSQMDQKRDFVCFWWGGGDKNKTMETTGFQKP
jgi:hypothetical protein